MNTKSNSNNTGVKSFLQDVAISPWIYKRNGVITKNPEITTITETHVYIPSTLTVDGSITASSLITPSDKMLKENITPIKEEKSKKLLSLTPVEYNLKIDPNKKLHLGLIAQEVEELFPELVEQGNLEYKHINYVEMISIIISQMKNMQSDIVRLNEKICELSKNK